MTLKERFLACETTAGKLIMKASAFTGVLVAIAGEGGQWIGLIPEDFVPVWVKTTIGIILFAGVAVGKMTAQSEPKK